MRLVAAEINMADAPGPRQKEKENKVLKREKAKHAMRSPVSPNQNSLAVMSAVFCCFYMQLFYIYL